MTALSRPVRRLLAVSLLVAAIAALWVGVAEPVVGEFAASRRTVAQSRDLIARYRRVAAGRAEVEQRIREARQIRPNAGRFLIGSSAELVAADLQNNVKGIVTGSGGKLKSTQLMPHEDKDEWRRVTIRVNMSSTPEAAIKVFHALETANPYLFLSNVQIRAPRKLSRARKTITPADAVLQIRYDVHGFMRAEGS